MNAKHLPLETVGAIVDGELEHGRGTAPQLHLEQCHVCSLAVLHAYQLKAATKKAATGRFVVSDDAIARMMKRGDQQTVRRATVIPFRVMAWSSIAAVLLLMIALGTWQQTRHSNDLSAELLDQHLAQLSDSSIPQVISTDKHTVKPWFQGKLPFSFNIPEQNTLPPNTTLVGADLTYIEGKPTALLLFRIKTHHVSVFLSQAGVLPKGGGISVRSGFNIGSTSVGGLDLFAVSDVERSELSALMEILAKAQ